MEELVGKIVTPGQSLGPPPPTASSALLLGRGLRQDNEVIVATRAGRLRCAHTKSSAATSPPAAATASKSGSSSSSKGEMTTRYWVQNDQRRYLPAVHDPVIGVVLARHSDSYKVDIGMSVPASLPLLAFEGATRKNRPNLQVGSTVYARVTVAHKDMDPELTCVGSSGRSDGFGALNDGYLVRCGSGLAQHLLSGQSAILKYLGKMFAYEVAIGLNGRVWVKSDSVKRTILISNAILNSEHLTAAQAHEMAQRLLKASD